jgi:hypothetical protein
VKQLKLGSEGLDYFRSFLAGGSHLAEAALQLIQDGDELLTWIPDDRDISKLSLKQSSLVPADAPHTESFWRPLEDVTRAFLDQSPEHLALIEAEYRCPVELIPSLIKGCSRWFEFRYFTSEPAVTDRAPAGPDTEGRLDVFGYLSGAGLSVEHAEDFIELASPFHQVIVLTSMDQHPMVPSGSHVPKEYLISFGQSATHVAVGAYDGDGVIMWTRPPGRAV